jgi:hypothetical protein
MKSAVMALTAVLCAATMTGAAEARNFGGGGGGMHMGGGHMGGHVGGHMGGHFGHVGHIGHSGWGHGGHWGHHHGWYGPGFGVGLYAPYYSSYYDDDDCYRVYRYHHWRWVCD